MTSPTYYFGYSEGDLLVIQAQKKVTGKNHTVSIIGRIRLDEILEIFR